MKKSYKNVTLLLALMSMTNAVKPAIEDGSEVCLQHEGGFFGQSFNYFTTFFRILEPVAVSFGFDCVGRSGHPVGPQSDRSATPVHIVQNAQSSSSSSADMPMDPKAGREDAAVRQARKDLFRLQKNAKQLCLTDRLYPTEEDIVAKLEHDKFKTLQEVTLKIQKAYRQFRDHKSRAADRETIKELNKDILRSPKAQATVEPDVWELLRDFVPIENQISAQHITDLEAEIRLSRGPLEEQVWDVKQIACKVVYQNFLQDLQNALTHALLPEQIATWLGLINSFIAHAKEKNLDFARTPEGGICGTLLKYREEFIVWARISMQYLQEKLNDFMTRSAELKAEFEKTKDPYTRGALEEIRDIIINDVCTRIKLLKNALNDAAALDQLCELSAQQIKPTIGLTTVSPIKFEEVTIDKPIGDSHDQQHGLPLATDAETDVIHLVDSDDKNSDDKSENTCSISSEDEPIINVEHNRDTRSVGADFLGTVTKPLVSQDNIAPQAASASSNQGNQGNLEIVDDTLNWLKACFDYRSKSDIPANSRMEGPNTPSTKKNYEPNTPSTGEPSSPGNLSSPGSPAPFIAIPSMPVYGSELPNFGSNIELSINRDSNSESEPDNYVNELDEATLADQRPDLGAGIGDLDDLHMKQRQKIHYLRAQQVLGSGQSDVGSDEAELLSSSQFVSPEVTPETQEARTPFNSSVPAVSAPASSPATATPARTTTPAPISATTDAPEITPENRNELKVIPSQSVSNKSEVLGNELSSRQSKENMKAQSSGDWSNMFTFETFGLGWVKAAVKQLTNSWTNRNQNQ